MNVPLIHPINGYALPIEIDPRPCELCGHTIDQHECVDDGEGPEFFCYPEDDIVTSWQLADLRDAWRHTGEAPPPASVRNSDITAPAIVPKQYRPPEATQQAFWYVASLDNPERLAAWLLDHPRDATYLRKLLEQKCSSAAR
jgi:hypothetical protein